MTDKFLYDARPKVRRQFAEELYARLERPQGFWGRVDAFRRTRLGIATSFLALLLMAGVVWQALSPEFHHEANIEGIDVYEMNYRIWMREDWAAPLPDEDSPQPLTEPGEYDPSEQASLWITVDELLERLTYTVHLPSYMPEGFSSTNRVQNDPNLWRYWVSLSWYRENPEGTIGLLFHQVADGTLEEVRVAPGKWELIDLKGTPAIVVRGDFESPFASNKEYSAFNQGDELFAYGYWKDEAGLRVVWIYDGVYYQLSSPTTFAGWFAYVRDLTPSVSEETLIHIAESMIP